MPAEPFDYTGRDNLEAMTEAVNYNNSLIGYVLDEVPTATHQDVLDFGAGSGTYADMLKERGLQIECLEPDGTLTGVLQSKGYATHSDASQLKPESLDAIYTFNVLEHIEDDAGAFASLAQALRKDGVIIAYVPAFMVLFSSMDRLVEHVRRYRTGDLRKLAIDNGLTITKLQYTEPIGFFAALVFRFVGNSSGELSPRSVRFYDRFAYPLSRLLEPIFRRWLGKNALLVARKS